MNLFRWNPLACSPPLQSNEVIVSDIIELNTDSPEGLEFNKAVTLAISHCATDLKGYEVVVKTLIDRDDNVWKDVVGTVDLRSLKGKNVLRYCKIPIISFHKITPPPPVRS